MKAEIINMLINIGCQLDSNAFPVIKNGGIVVPGTSTIFPLDPGKEYKHATRKERRSTATSSWGRTSPWQPSTQGSFITWSPRGPRPTGETTSVFVSGICKQYETEMSLVKVAYPGTQVWASDAGIWLIAESGLLPGVFPKFNFVVGIDFVSGHVRGWCFQGNHVIGYEWIGPRHTNFPDGSICAYDPRDRTWVLGDPLVVLLDLYTLWAFRHLHLRAIGRWPGAQSIPHVYERILELNDNEHCGCENSQLPYKKCCKTLDSRQPLLREAIRFTLEMTGGIRKPPRKIIDFIRERSDPPSIGALTALT